MSDTDLERHRRQEIRPDYSADEGSGSIAFLGAVITPSGAIVVDHYVKVVPMTVTGLEVEGAAGQFHLGGNLIVPLLIGPGVPHQPDAHVLVRTVDWRYVCEAGFPSICGSICVYVTECQTGLAVADADVSIYDTADPPNLLGSGVTDHDGKFCVSITGAIDYVIQAGKGRWSYTSAPDSATCTQNVVFPQAPRPTTVIVEGCAPSLIQDGLPGTVVTITSQVAADVITITTDEIGHALFSDLPYFGFYDITIIEPSGRFEEYVSTAYLGCFYYLGDPNLVIALTPTIDYVCAAYFRDTEVRPCPYPVAKVLHLTDEYGPVTLTWDGGTSRWLGSTTVQYTGDGLNCFPVANLPVDYKLAPNSNGTWNLTVRFPGIDTFSPCPGTSATIFKIETIHTDVSTCPTAFSVTFTTPPFTTVAVFPETAHVYWTPGGTIIVTE